VQADRRQCPSRARAADGSFAPLITGDASGSMALETEAKNSIAWHAGQPVNFPVIEQMHDAQTLAWRTTLFG
jgi:hypothetical protein